MTAGKDRYLITEDAMKDIWAKVEELQRRNELERKLKKAKANAAKWQSTADGYCKKMNDAMAVLSEWNNIDKAEAIARWNEFTATFPGGLGQAQQALHMSRAAVEALGLKWEETSPSDIREKISALAGTTGPFEVDAGEPRCQYCGYTEQDKREMMDHHICEQKQVEESTRRKRKP